MSKVAWGMVLVAVLSVAIGLGVFTFYRAKGSLPLHGGE